jgi:hypothetical protein
MSEYLRTQGGQKVHRADGCQWGRKAKTAVPWDWASGKDFDQLVQDFTAARGHDPTIWLCGHCFTIAEQSRWWYRVRSTAP